MDNPRIQSALATFREELVESVSLAQEGVMSGAWAYPLLGISYTASHPSLYQSVLPVLSKALMTSVGITGAMFFFTYLPQLALCAIVTGPFAFIPAAVLVLAESYALITFVSRAFFLNEAQDKIFDAVLLQQGNMELVQAGREVQSSSSGTKKLGKSLSKPLNRFSPENIIRYLISLPLNSIPIVGTVLFLLYNGRKLGPSFHGRYFQLKRFKKAESEGFVSQRKAEYTAFGVTALLLNLVPIAGFAFSLTSTVGAALWAGKLEKAGGKAGGSVEMTERPAEIGQDKERVEL